MHISQTCHPFLVLQKIGLLSEMVSVFEKQGRSMTHLVSNSVYSSGRNLIWAPHPLRRILDWGRSWKVFILHTLPVPNALAAVQPTTVHFISFPVDDLSLAWIQTLIGFHQKRRTRCVMQRLRSSNWPKCPGCESNGIFYNEISREAKTS